MTYTDQLKRQVELPSTPKRIISAVPSQTELLYDLGLDREVIGITKFCVRPESWFRNKTRIGGTKNLNIEKIASMEPDLILANMEENTKEQIEALEKIAPVWVSDIHTLDDAMEMIRAVGTITNRLKEALKICEGITTAFASLLPLPPKKVMYLIWNDPYMSVGPDTFVSHLLERCGLENCIHELRYPTITKEQIQHLEPDLIFLSSEPFPFKPKHIAELQKLAPHSRIHMVDGEMFSWYGSRLLKAPGYFKEMKVLLDEIGFELKR